MSLGKVLTYFAVIFSVLAALSIVSISLLKWGMFCAIAGIICSVFVIFRRMQYMLEIKWYHPAIIALLLSSVPIIYLITIIFIFKD